MHQKVPYLLIGVLIGIIVMQWAMPAAESQSGIVRGNTFLLEDMAGNVKGAFWITSDGTPALRIDGAEGSAVLWITSDGIPTLTLGESDGVLMTLMASPTLGALVRGEIGNIWFGMAATSGYGALLQTMTGKTETKIYSGIDERSQVFVLGKEASAVSVHLDQTLQDGALITASEDNGGIIETHKSGRTTGTLPLVLPSAAKPVTWGQIKADPVQMPSYAAKPSVPDIPDITAKMQQLKEEYRRKLASLR